MSALNLFFRTCRDPATADGRSPPGGQRDSQRSAGCCYDHSVLNAPLAQLAEQRTLNPRVRGSSPWRRTRDDLGFHPSRLFFMCSVCPHVGSMFARELGPGRGGLCEIWPERSLRCLTWVGRWSIPLLGVLSFDSLIQLRSVKPAGSVQSHERHTGRAGRGQPQVSRKRG